MAMKAILQPRHSFKTEKMIIIIWALSLSSILPQNQIYLSGKYDAHWAYSLTFNSTLSLLDTKYWVRCFGDCKLVTHCKYLYAFLITNYWFLEPLCRMAFCWMVHCKKISQNCTFFPFFRFMDSKYWTLSMLLFSSPKYWFNVIFRTSNIDMDPNTESKGGSDLTVELMLCFSNLGDLHWWFTSLICLVVKWATLSADPPLVCVYSTQIPNTCLTVKGGSPPGLPSVEAGGAICPWASGSKGSHDWRFLTFWLQEMLRNAF